MHREIKFSVILPICHGGKFLKNALISLAKLEFLRERFEVLCAGQDNDEELRHIFETASANKKIDLHFIPVAKSNRSAQLNGAISQARGNILVFTDDDCIFPSDWLDKLVKVFERESNIGVVGGLDRTGTEEPPLNRALDYVLNSFLGTGGLRRQGSSVGKYYPKLWNMAIPREVALNLAINGKEGPPQVFNESLDVHEDVELIHRIEKTGKRIISAAEITVIHSRDTTLQSFTSRSFNMARTSRSIGVHRLPHLLLASFALGMIVLALGSAFSLSIRTISSTVSAIYVAILLVSGLGGYIRTGQFLVFFYVPILLLVLHFSRGLGYLFPWRELH